MCRSASMPADSGRRPWLGPEHRLLASASGAPLPAATCSPPQHRFAQDLIARRQRPGSQNVPLQDVPERQQFLRVWIHNEQVIKTPEYLARSLLGLAHHMLQSGQFSTKCLLATRAQPVSDIRWPPLLIVWKRAPFQHPGRNRRPTQFEAELRRSMKVELVEPMIGASGFAQSTQKPQVELERFAMDRTCLGSQIKVTQSFGNVITIQLVLSRPQRNQRSTMVGTNRDEGQRPDATQSWANLQAVGHPRPPLPPALVAGKRMPANLTPPSLIFGVPLRNSVNATPDRSASLSMATPSPAVKSFCRMPMSRSNSRKKARFICARREAKEVAVSPGMRGTERGSLAISSK